MTMLNIPIPDTLRRELEAQASAHGCASPEEFVLRLIENEVAGFEDDQTERLVLEGLNSGPSAPLDRKEWEDIRREVHQRLGGRLPQ